MRTTLSRIALLAVALSCTAFALPQDRPGAPTDATKARAGVRPDVAVGNQGVRPDAPKPDGISSVSVTNDEVELAQRRVSAINAKLVAAEADLDRARARFKAGIETNHEVLTLEGTVKVLEADLADAVTTLDDARRIAALSIVLSNLDFQKANIRSAVDLLGRMGVLKITVDESVPNDLVVTTRVQNLPLGQVLEVIANTVNLQIVPSDDGGVKLTMPGKLKAGGHLIEYRGQNWPWGDAWRTYSIGGGHPPIGSIWRTITPRYSPMGTPAPAVPFAHPLADATPPQTGPAVVYGGPFTVTALGSSMLVISERGTGPHREQGLWLTVYKVKNGGLTQHSRVFHSSSGSGSSVVKGLGSRTKARAKSKAKSK